MINTSQVKLAEEFAWHLEAWELGSIDSMGLAGFLDQNLGARVTKEIWMRVTADIRYDQFNANVLSKWLKEDENDRQHHVIRKVMGALVQDAKYEAFKAPLNDPEKACRKLGETVQKELAERRSKNMAMGEYHVQAYVAQHDLSIHLQVRTPIDITLADVSNEFGMLPPRREPPFKPVPMTFPPEKIDDTRELNNDQFAREFKRRLQEDRVTGGRRRD